MQLWAAGGRLGPRNRWPSVQRAAIPPALTSSSYLLDCCSYPAPPAPHLVQAESDLRALLGIPDNYKVLFLQGGASTMFAAIPLNLSKASLVLFCCWRRRC